jgi:hypothetical protein
MQTAVPTPTEADRQAIAGVIHRYETELPAGVRRIDIEYGEDWTGYPTVRLSFIVPKGMEGKQGLINDLNDFNDRLGNEIIQLRSYWPSVRVVTED